MKDLREYIESLMTAGEVMTEAEWRALIAKEEKDYNETLTDEEKDHIIDELANAGLVKEAE